MSHLGNAGQKHLIKQPRVLRATPDPSKVENKVRVPPGRPKSSTKPEPFGERCRRMPKLPSDPQAYCVNRSADFYPYPGEPCKSAYVMSGYSRVARRGAFSDYSHNRHHPEKATEQKNKHSG